MMDEEEYVHKFYSEHADEFSQTRYNNWSSVTNFIKSLPPNSSMLDVGCGNGKNMMIRDDLEYTGCDMCQNLLDICKEKGEWNLTKCDIKNLPFKDNSFDNAISIAVIHHLSHSLHRLRACHEIVRVVKPGGKILIEVWADKGVNNNKFRRLNNDGDYIVMWKNEHQRFYHMFSETELNKLIGKINGVRLIEKKEEANNWIFVLEKTG